MHRLEGPHELYQAIGAAGAVPFFVIMDRRFSLVGKIVDAFLDPEHHVASAWLPLSDVKRRNALTERLVDELDEDLLVQFADAYRAPSASNFPAVLEALVADRASRDDELLRESFEGALSVVGELVTYENYDGAFGRHGAVALLNLPAVGHLLRLVDRAAHARGVRFDVAHGSAAGVRAAASVPNQSVGTASR